jgi:hypothetical protein
MVTGVILLNNNHAAPQTLNRGDQLTDTFIVQTADGTPQTVTILINGTTNGNTLALGSVPFQPITYASTAASAASYVDSLSGRVLENYSIKNTPQQFTYNLLPSNFEVSQKRENMNVVTRLVEAVNALKEVTVAPLAAKGENEAMRELEIKLQTSDNRLVNAEDFDQVKVEQPSSTQENTSAKSTETKNENNVQASITRAQKDVYAQQMNFEQKVKVILNDFGLG